MVSNRAVIVARLRKGFAWILDPIEDFFDRSRTVRSWRAFHRQYAHGYPNIRERWDQPQ